MKSDQAKGAFLKTPIVAAALALVFAAAGCGGGEVDRAAVDAHAQAHEPIYGPLAALHSKDPCSLLTKDEIVAQLELSREASQREALRRRGVSWEISSEEFSQEASRSCQIAWRGTVDGAPFSLGGFTLHLTIADRLKDVLANEPNPKRIPGVGDEAFFLRHAPYARVGDLAIGVNFPKGDEAKAGLALLRIAVQRLRSFVQSSGVSEVDRVLPEIEFTSWAWGAMHTGFHIDATGNVYRYDRDGRPWNKPDSATLTQRDLSDRYAPINELRFTRPPEEVRQLIGKIDAAAQGRLSKPKSRCRDAGSLSYLVYAYDANRGRYSPVQLRSEGGWAQENTSSPASSRRWPSVFRPRALQMASGNTAEGVGALRAAFTRPARCPGRSTLTACPARRVCEPVPKR